MVGVQSVVKESDCRLFVLSWVVRRVWYYGICVSWFAENGDVHVCELSMDGDVKIVDFVMFFSFFCELHIRV